MSEDEKVRLIADEICAAGADWLEAPLHQMAYDDMARAALAMVRKLEK